MELGLSFKITLISLVLIMRQCGAQIQDVNTQFVGRKIVATSHLILQQYSKIKCVKKCHEENLKGLCNVAGYNKTTQTCYISVDSQQDVLDVADDMAGVFFMSPMTQEQQGKVILHAK